MYRVVPLERVITALDCIMDNVQQLTSISIHCFSQLIFWMTFSWRRMSENWFIHPDVWYVYSMHFPICVLVIFWKLGGISIQRCHLTSIGIPMLKIRRSRDRFIFNMEIPIPGKDGLYIEMEPWFRRTSKTEFNHNRRSCCIDVPI